MNVVFVAISLIVQAMIVIVLEIRSKLLQRLIHSCLDLYMISVNHLVRWTDFKDFVFCQQQTDSYRLCEPIWKLCIHINDERRLFSSTMCQTICLLIFRPRYMNDLQASKTCLQQIYVLQVTLKRILLVPKPSSLIENNPQKK